MVNCPTECEAVVSSERARPCETECRAFIEPKRQKGVGGFVREVMNHKLVYHIALNPDYECVQQTRAFDKYLCGLSTFFNLLQDQGEGKSL